MTDIIHWVKVNAEFMAADLPDIWTVDEATETLYDWMQRLRNMAEAEGPGGGSFSAGSYTLSFESEDDTENWQLLRHVSTASLFFDEGSVLIYGEVGDSQIISFDLGLPSVLDDDAISD